MPDLDSNPQSNQLVDLFISAGNVSAVICCEDGDDRGVRLRVRTAATNGPIFHP
jgi:hypothetical protein